MTRTVLTLALFAASAPAALGETNETILARIKAAEASARDDAQDADIASLKKAVQVLTARLDQCCPAPAGTQYKAVGNTVYACTDAGCNPLTGVAGKSCPAGVCGPNCPCPPGCCPNCCPPVVNPVPAPFVVDEDTRPPGMKSVRAASYLPAVSYSAPRYAPAPVAYAGTTYGQPLYATSVTGYYSGGSTRTGIFGRRASRGSGGCAGCK